MTAWDPNARSLRNTAVLIPSSQITARVKGGKLNVISRPRKGNTPASSRYRTQRSGKGTTGKLRCPSLSTALTAKVTLSLESFRVVRRTLPTFWTCSHSGLVVARQRTSYPVARPPGGTSQVRAESFSKSLVSKWTFAGGAGADASDDRVAAFSFTKRRTYSKSTEFGRSPYSIPFWARTF